MLVMPSIDCSLLALRLPPMCGVEALPTLFTPGTSNAKSKGLRPLSGSSRMVWLWMVSPRLEVSTSRVSVVALTSTVCSHRAHVQLEVHRTGLGDLDQNVILFAGLKPLASTVTV